jgi:diguanylate cyclase (GGDEF)-like protein
MTDDLLNSLVSRLQCAHVVVHAPSWFADQVVPPPPGDTAAGIDSLTRHLLWSMARERSTPQILNRMRLKHGGPVMPYRILFCPLLDDGRAIGLIAAIRLQAQAEFVPADIAILQEAVPQVQEQLGGRVEAHTGLLRRPVFELEVAQRASDSEPACVVYADLDQMHAINEIAGFGAGDEVLRDIGRLWQSRLLPSGSIATHLSGDRYAAVLFNHTMNQARNWADRAREAIEALTFKAAQTRVTASLGVVSLNNAASFQHALAAAETACRVAKERGRNRVEIYEIADATMIRRHEEVRESRVMIDALEDNRFVLHAQPIVSLVAPRRCSHFEVLLRIKDQDGRLVSVGEYMRAADRYQLLERLDRWVVENVLQTITPQAQRLSALGVRFAINLTGQSISQPTFADFVRTAVKQHDVPAGMLAFEFTETAAVRNIGATKRFIERMSDLGAAIALDDFGTGLSSLMHLKELVIDQIKIDGSFIRDLLSNSRSEALVRALVLIAEELQLETVAEFVETEDVAARLRALGVGYAQGYLYGKPQPLSAALAELLPESAPPLLVSAKR